METRQIFILDLLRTIVNQTFLFKQHFRDKNSEILMRNQAGFQNNQNIKAGTNNGSKQNMIAEKIQPHNQTHNRNCKFQEGF